MIRTYAALAAAVVAAAVLAPSAQAGAMAEAMVPDLRQGPVGCPGGFAGDPATCTDWDVCLVEDADAPKGRCIGYFGKAKAVRLRFTTSVDNVGDGPMLLFSHRDSVDQPLMSVRQAFQLGAGGPLPNSYGEAQASTPATAYYEPAESHHHWHLNGFDRFQLRDHLGAAVVSDRKNGFCLGDRYVTKDADDLPHTPRDTASPTGELAKYLRENYCGMHQPSALDVTQGISVGAGDEYEFRIGYQWLDITHVPSGTYDLVHTVNEDRGLIEKNYDNNSSSIAISIQWPPATADAPGPITGAPEVKLLRSCPGESHCLGR
ncbi:lysyl oxidase family protein [Actinokineospora xionganensis]|uniref:Lysyl oxidase n=1 Tax=Actinokineospora xionganensis TaxID=2684470 RepID=A0ABR7L820_9PSEU|nr:lysyl oxidase family protein [Actinokineospora xionganensis]MBC6448846.1 lysyl oxidase [Actinokineospora xionganensis]